jgi:hypothetical protein
MVEYVHHMRSVVQVGHGGRGMKAAAAPAAPSRRRSDSMLMMLMMTPGGRAQLDVMVRFWMESELESVGGKE